MNHGYHKWVIYLHPIPLDNTHCFNISKRHNPINELLHQKIFMNNKKSLQFQITCQINSHIRLTNTTPCNQKSTTMCLESPNNFINNGHLLWSHCSIIAYIKLRIRI